jgi:hypothetical protein
VRAPVKLGLFALALSLSFGAGAALGAAVPEVGGEAEPVKTEHPSDQQPAEQHPVEHVGTTGPASPGVQEP